MCCGVQWLASRACMLLSKPHGGVFVDLLANRTSGLNKTPIVGHKDIDLQLLYNEVLQRGGGAEVNLQSSFSMSRACESFPKDG